MDRKEGGEVVRTKTLLKGPILSVKLLSRTTIEDGRFFSLPVLVCT